jgi:hypothetical protein
MLVSTKQTNKHDFDADVDFWIIESLWKTNLPSREFIIVTEYSTQRDIPESIH